MHVLSLVVVLVSAANIGTYANRRSVLLAAGWALLISERVEPADVIVVVTEAEGAGVLERRWRRCV